MRPGGWFVALWNPRYIQASPLLTDIEAELERLKPDMKRVSSARQGLLDELSDRLTASPHFDDVILLVRDPRDSLYSWHKFRTDFAKDPSDLLAGSFAQWLDQPDPAGVSRLEDWWSFYDAWDQARGRFQRSTVTTFEDLKTDPVPALRKSLEDLEVDVRQSDLVRAIERSSFDSMRAHEERRSDTGGNGSATGTRIMRSGTPNEWHDWMTPGLPEKFSTGQIADVARRFGYEMTAT